MTPGSPRMMVLLQPARAGLVYNYSNIANFTDGESHGVNLWETRTVASGAAGIAAAAIDIGGDQGFIHDAANGLRAAPALRATAKAAIHLARRARRRAVTGKRPADVVVSEHVTRTNDHRDWPGARWYQVQLSHSRRERRFQPKYLLCTYSNSLN
jgi:hypothetical protein